MVENFQLVNEAEEEVGRSKEEEVEKQFSELLIQWI